MASSNILLDDYKECGNTFEKFKEEITKLAKATKISVANCQNLTFYSSCKIPELEKPDRSIFYCLSQENISLFKTAGKIPRPLSLTHTEENEVLINECNNTSELILQNLEEESDNKYIVSDIAFSPLLKQLGLGGSFASNNHSLIGNMMLAEAAYTRNDKLSFVYRETAENKKIFLVVGTYAYEGFTSQIILIPVVNYMLENMNATVEEWEITQKITKIKVMFCDKTIYVNGESIVPGILITNSDIARSSFKCQLILQTGSEYVIYEERTKKHTSEITPDMVYSMIDDLYLKINDIENMFDLVKETYINSQDQQMNAFYMMNNINILNNVIEQVGIDYGFLPKKRTDSITEAIQEYIDSGKLYTVADLVLWFIQVPLELQKNANEVLLEQLRIVCGEMLEKFYKKVKLINAYD